MQIAMRDLDISGAGDLLGAEQSGFINELGFDMYQRILAEAVKELKEEQFKDLMEAEQAASGQYVEETVLGNRLEPAHPRPLHQRHSGTHLAVQRTGQPQQCK